ncbi:MAG: hypothetical protein H0A75_06270 [Candidatus Methanofishera endochildressiae]|uniref:Uncharacterized protein n=1 Tax=Candidatus Methanofishera endochildressiae TaxID=2738884 RepID=A0A7Z0SE01_9GAMM|nr:hypothetical protein [Candidatus Methanofishera endochildressiae]
MPKQIIYDAPARLKFMAGINKIANAVSATYGSAGPAVMIQHVADGLTPVFTRDGVTVARSINCQTVPGEDLGPGNFCVMLQVLYPDRLEMVLPRPVSWRRKFPGQCREKI